MTLNRLANISYLWLLGNIFVKTEFGCIGPQGVARKPLNYHRNGSRPPFWPFCHPRAGGNPTSGKGVLMRHLLIVTILGGVAFAQQPAAIQANATHEAGAQLASNLEAP